MKPRCIQGRKYDWMQSTETKAEAKKVAERLREKGYYIRVKLIPKTHIYWGKDKYAIWGAKK